VIYKVRIEISRLFSESEIDEDTDRDDGTEKQGNLVRIRACIALWRETTIRVDHFIA
jgi:hypothetical protein